MVGTRTGLAFLTLAISFSWFACAQAAIEIEIHNTPDAKDDYVSWSPVRARIRQVGGTANQDVFVGSSARATMGKQGEVCFQVAGAAPPSSTTFTPLDSMPLTLKGDGTWSEFWIAGKLASSGDVMPSGGAAVDGKDVLVIVTDQAGTVLHQHPTMVRVRKNAESLSDGEIKRFLNAVAVLHDLDRIGLPQHDSKYLKYVKVHGDAFFMGIHHVPAFPPWHRTMLLSFERELQQIDPSVSLPYWKFDEKAPRLFTNKFIGVVLPGSPMVAFDNGNPLKKWLMPTNAAIQSWSQGTLPPKCIESLIRQRNAGTSAPAVDYADVENRPNYSLMNSFLESNYHNDAHSFINGWLGDITSPKDPLFFLLHANVDRGWLQWQMNKKAFDEANPLHYFPQGDYAPGTAHQGSFANDSQWPWNLRGGGQGTADGGDDWPDFTIPLLSGNPNLGPSAIPLTKQAVDCMNVKGTGLPHNYGYDDIKYK